MIKTCKGLTELIKKSQHIILVPAYLFIFIGICLLYIIIGFTMAFSNQYIMHFYHTNPYNLFLFPSPTHWIPSFSLLVLLLHSHLYLLFFYDLLSSIRAASNILVEGLFQKSMYSFLWLQQWGKLYTCVSTIPK